jgi:hypothetical protein
LCKLSVDRLGQGFQRGTAHTNKLAKGVYNTPLDPRVLRVFSSQLAQKECIDTIDGSLGGLPGCIN